ncbi:MAG: phosphotransferase [Flavobacteriales bacterium]|nr:phosphotransferase [Flavobacteriales bacterium]
MPTAFSPDFLLEVNDPNGLSAYLRNNDHLLEGERLEHLEVAGEGNMNVVLRATTDQRSIILKQSRPWVHKYPSIKAPVNRIATEFEFYRTVRENAIIRKYIPEVLCYDERNFILCLEDFGPASDFSFIYRKGALLDKRHMADMSKVVSELHFGFKDFPKNPRISNDELRKLNHAHIFDLPLNPNNGFDLDGVVPGLQHATEKFRNDAGLQKKAKELGEVYLSNNGTRLLHGDYYPGSWLNTANGFRMIDPEFSFVGPPEFELGVAIAHLKLADQPDSLIKDLFVYYHFDGRFDGTLLTKFAGMEMMRRLIGLAQLPLELDLKERLEMLDEAYENVMNG